MSQTDSPQNLELLSATTGFAIANVVIAAKSTQSESAERDQIKRKEKAAKSAENLITQALGVLQGQGVYAIFLLLAAKKETGYEPLRNHCVDVINNVTGASLAQDRQFLQTLATDSAILNDLPTLLLVRRVLEQTLIYARYHAKATGATESE